MKKKTTTVLVPAAQIERTIRRLRGHNVLLDADLAALYGVGTRELVQAVKRNRRRFPADFMFRLSEQEYENLRSQFVISSPGHGGRRSTPYAFTEQGIAMLSGVLRSARAIRVNIEIMRAFVRLRRLLESHADLVRRLDELEEQYDEQFKIVFKAIRELMAPPRTPKRQIGFRGVPADRSRQHAALKARVAGTR